MNEYFKSLIDLVPPPETPIGTIGDWRSAEAAIGTPLPDDYKWFVRSYGTGAIGRMPIWIINGLASSLWVHLASVTTAYNDLFSEDSEQLPYALYPSKGGLLPCGATGNGDYIHWVTKGFPNEWQIVFHNFGRMTFECFDANLIQFLVRTIKKEYDVAPSELLETPVRFTPTQTEFVRP